jgi:TolB-like protein
MLKKINLKMATFTFGIMMVCSCVSLQDRALTMNEVNQVVFLGNVTAQFNSFQGPYFVIHSNRVRQKAYEELMKIARQQYQGNIEVRNIVILGSGGGWTIFNITLGYLMLLSNVQRITATGDVVMLGTVLSNQPQPTRPEQRSPANMIGIDGVIYRTSNNLIIDLPENTRIAVLNVSSNDRGLSAFVVDELEFHLVSSRKFSIVDRNTLDAIRSEQNFQMSGEVSDSSAVSIGQMLGANIVITGNIAITGNTQRLSLRAIDVQTARIMTMVREAF